MSLYPLLKQFLDEFLMATDKQIKQLYEELEINKIEDIHTIEFALEELEFMRGYRYYMNRDGSLNEQET